MKTRIKYLDGHRGIAIFLVILYHAYTRWTDIVPYGDSYENVFLFQYGWLGVQLFFLISGFVILMTLEACKGSGEFLFRRWLRLFPAMLFCSLLVFLTSSFFIDRPGGQPELKSLLPGLTFISPQWWESIINQPVIQLEGAFWSIYVEFKFYVFSAIVYFWRGRLFLIASLILVFLISASLAAANKYIGGSIILSISSLLAEAGFQHFGWFASGATLYIYKQTKEKKILALAMVIGVLSVIATSKLVLGNFMAALFVLSFFIISISSRLVQKILEIRLLQFLGFISYPLYLIHENAMIAMIIKIGSVIKIIPGVIIPFFPIIILIFISYIISRNIEPVIRKAVLNIFVWREGARKNCRNDVN